MTTTGDAAESSRSWNTRPLRTGILNTSAANLLETVAAASILTFLNPNEKVSAHLNAGNAYDALMNQVRIFYSIDCWAGDTEATLTEKLKYFSAQKNELNAKCPQIPTFAYRRGKEGVERGEAKFSVDDKPAEITMDTRELPPSRRNSQ